jgi:antirestriction protein
MKTETATVRIYVGTYGKYNAGSIKGAWLDLEDYSDKDAFLTACAELHKDESDPEFMFQDSEGIPYGYADESSIDGDLWEWLALDESDQDILTAYCAAMGQKMSFNDAQDAFAGIYADGATFAESIAEETGAVPKDFPTWISIDWERTWGCNLRHDYLTEDHKGETYFFRNC